MAPRHSKEDGDASRSLPSLPLDAVHWQAIVKSLGLSRQQARIVELLLRGGRQRQIAAALGITEPTLKSYLQRIFARTSTHNRMELAMKVLALSHDGCRDGGSHPNR